MKNRNRPSKFEVTAVLALLVSVLALATSLFGIYRQYFWTKNSLNFGVSYGTIDTTKKSVSVLYYLANTGNKPAVVEAVIAKLQGIPFQSPGGKPAVPRGSTYTLMFNKPTVVKPGDTLVEKGDACLGTLFEVKNSVVLSVTVKAVDGSGNFYSYDSPVLRVDFDPGWPSNGHGGILGPINSIEAAARTLVTQPYGGEVFKKSLREPVVYSFGYYYLDGKPFPKALAPLDLDPDCQHTYTRPI